MKICSKCKEEKNYGEFNKCKTRQDRHQSYCRQCSKTYRESNIDKILEENRAWRANNKDKHRQATNSWRKDNLDRYRNYQSRWDNDNRDKKTSYLAKYRAQKLKATPPWLTEEHLEDMKLIYKEAQELQLDDNIERHVDHIIPLQGEKVSGLHVPWNLQILTKEENLSKGNKLE